MGQHPNRAHARAAAAMRNGKRLVQIDVSDIGADLGRSADAHQRVEIGAVHVDLPTMVMNDLTNIPYPLLKDTVCRRVSDHQRGEFFLVGGSFVAKVIQVYVAVFITFDNDHPHSRHDGTGRVGAMRGRRNQADVPVALAVGFVKGPDTEQAGVFSLGTGVGLQGDGMEPRDLTQHILELLKELLVALGLFQRRKRMQICEIPYRDRLQLGRRIKFHCA